MERLYTQQGEIMGSLLSRPAFLEMDINGQSTEEPCTVTKHHMHERNLNSPTTSISLQRLRVLIVFLSNNISAIALTIYTLCSSYNLHSRRKCCTVSRLLSHSLGLAASFFQCISLLKLVLLCKSLAYDMFTDLIPHHTIFFFTVGINSLVVVPLIDLSQESCQAFVC